MEQELKTRISVIELARLVNVAINDLGFNKLLVAELNELREQKKLDEDLFMNLFEAILNLSIEKADCLKDLTMDYSCIRPSDDGVKLIEFWLEAGRQIEELEDENEQED